MPNRLENSKFALRNQKEITSILEKMVTQRTSINLDTSSGLSMNTFVLEVLAAEKQVYVDVSADVRLNEKLSESENLTFCTPSGVKIRWQSPKLEWLELSEGNQVFAIPLPTVMERIQRRDYFRLNTPNGARALYCKIPHEMGQLEAALVDISIGGIQMIIRGELPSIMTQGAIVAGCSIQFPQIGAVPLTLKFCGIWSSVDGKSGEGIHRIGMEFLNLSRGAGNLIQRYLIELEQEHLVRVL